MIAMRHFSPADRGSYYVEPYTLIGHEAADVMIWAAAHPDYTGSIEFERWDFEGSVEVRSEFYPKADDAAGTVGGVELARVA